MIGVLGFATVAADATFAISLVTIQVGVMKYLKNYLARLPFSKNRRKSTEALKRLWQPAPLAKTERQSNGSLYDYFLGSSSRDLHKTHHYFDIYERHLGRFVGTPLRFLEIGVFKGGSLRMWRQFFGPEATIVGIDIDKGCARFDGQHGAVRIGDQTDEDFLKSVNDEFGPFDVILDDGGHNPSHQVISFCYLYPAMTPNGVYICEDTQVNFWPKRQDLGRKTTFMNLATSIALHLTEPSYPRKNWNRFSLHPTDRDGELLVSSVSATTASVHFYDSIVAFERCPKAEPFHEER